jgi:hypothetical protein
MRAQIGLILFLTVMLFASASAIEPMAPTKVVQEYLSVLATAKSPDVLDKYCSQRALAEQNGFLKSLPVERKNKYKLSQVKLTGSEQTSIGRDNGRLGPGHSRKDW